MFKLAQGSLKNRAFIALVSLAITIIGIFSMTSMKQELIPSVELPAVQVMTISPGATSEQMKDRVSTPIESQLQTIPEVERTTTQSRSSMSMVMVELEYGTDIARATSKIELAVSRADENFPEDAETEVISGGTSDIPLAYVGVTSSGDAMETADRVRTTVIPELERISGIANVMLAGAPEPIIRLQLDQAKIAELGIPQDAIQNALEDNGLSVPVGTLTRENQVLDVTVGQELGSLDDLNNIPIVASQEDITMPDGSTAPGPATVYPLSDIATAEMTTADTSTVSRIDGKDAVALLIFPTASANLVETTDLVNEKLDELAPIVGGDTTFTTLFEQAPFITQSTRSLAEEGAMGLVFAVAVILIFLTSIRSTIVTAISIPLSLLFGFVGMMVSGYTLNMLTLSALTITIGRVVDDSIVVIENIKRHLEYGGEKKKAILEAVREVSGAITASTIVSLIVFLPIAFVSGLIGELFRPFALTVVIAMAGSLIVALTIVPVLAYWFLKPSAQAQLAIRQNKVDEYRDHAEEKEEKYWLRRAYAPAFRTTQRHPWVTLVASLVILAGTVAIFPLLKVNLLGASGQNMVMLTQEVRPGDSLETQVEQATAVEDAITDIDGVETIGITIGNTGFGETGISYMITTDPSVDQQELSDTIVETAQEVAGDQEVTSAETAMFPSTIEIDITAPDSETLQAASDQMVDELSGLDTVAHVESNLTAEAPAVQVTVNRDAAAERGMTENDIVGIIAAQMVEPSIGTITIDNIDTEIYMSIADPVTTVDELRALEVAGGPIEEVATIEEVLSVPVIITKDGQTTATISITPTNPDNLGEASDDVTAAVDSLELPDGAVSSMGGAAEQLTDSFNKLILALVAAVLLIYVTLVWIFKSLLQPALLLISIPFAGIGSFLALLITDTALDMSAMIGLLMLTGIVVTNAIVLIDLINQYRERGMDLSTAIDQGTMRRLRPIIMTAVATIAAMVPMALGFSESTGFISQPLAVAVIGGLISSTLLTLVLLPVIYRLVEARKIKRAEKREAKQQEKLDALERETETTEA